MYKLINSIELLSNQKSFTLTIVNATKQLWLLMHFKNLKIAKKSIYYSKTPSLRSRKITVYPLRKLNKSFDDTGHLLDYLESKCYNIRHFELEFENNFRIVISSNIWVTFYADSKEERNKLINKLVDIAGFDRFPIENLSINITYNFGEKSSRIENGMGVSPDEFWSEEQKNIWGKEVRKEFESDEELEIKRYDFYDNIAQKNFSN